MRQGYWKLFGIFPGEQRRREMARCRHLVTIEVEALDALRHGITGLVAIEYDADRNIVNEIKNLESRLTLAHS